MSGYSDNLVGKGCCHVYILWFSETGHAVRTSLHQSAKRALGRLGDNYRRLVGEPLERRDLLSVVPLSVVPLDVALVSDAVVQAQQIRAAAAKDTIVVVYHSDTMTTTGLVNLVKSVSAAHDGALIANLGIVAHGGPGEIDLGKGDVLSLATLPGQTAELEQLRSLLTDHAIVDLYSCSVAAGAAGKTFVDELAADTGAAVFASDNPVGTVRGADFIWEYHTGHAAVRNELFSMQKIEAIPGLCLYTYTSPADITNAAYHYPNNPIANATDYNVGQCTWFVYGRIRETNLISAQTLASLGIFQDSASNWLSEAKSSAAAAAGITWGTTPKPGAIACYASHVAFVENTAGQMTESNLDPRVPYPSSEVVVDGVEGTNQTPHLNQNYVWLHSSRDSSVSTRVWQAPQFTVMQVKGGPVTANGYQWFELSDNAGHDGYAALLDANTGIAAPAGDVVLNFTGIQRSPGTPWISTASVTGYIYLPSGSQPNLTPVQPSGWSAPIVVSNVTGTNTDSSPLYTTNNLYVDWAVTNNGAAATAAAFTSALYVDGNSVPITTFNTPSPLGVGSNSTALDYNIGSLSAGTHTLRIVLDSTNVITESNESDNSYTKTFTVVAPVSQPNLTPVQPSGWSAPIVVSNVTGTNTDSSPLYTTNNLYVDWAVTNNGAAATAAAFTSALYVDGNSVPITTFNTPSPLGVGSNSTALDYNIGSLSAGTHTLRIVLDSTNVITESNESDNSYTKTFTVVAPVSQPNLTPVQPSGWSAPIVVSNVTGTNTDSSPLYTTNNLYVDWAVTNNGAAATAAAFTSALYVDGNSVPITTFNTPSPLGVGSNSTALDYNIGSLSAGTHTLRIVLDSTNVITESNESDNSYTKTFTVVAPVSQPNLTPVQPSGWSAPIVVSNVTGTNTDSSPLYTTNNLYVDWAVTNNGAAATAAAFTSALYVDGNSVPITTFNTPSPLGVGSNSTALDYNIGSLSAGTHTLRIVLDSTNVITESNESDNSYTKTFTVVAPVSQPNLTPVQPSGWSAPIVVSNVTGTNTDSSPLYTTNNLYVDWAVTNNGAAATAAAFTSALYVDGNSVPITTFNTPSPLGVGSNSTALDYNIGSLSAGTHTLRIVLDSTNVITESNESDNSYTKTFTVVAPVSQPNLTPVQPSGWSAPIVVSNVTGTNTDSSPLYTTNNLYVDWAVTNNGAAATAAAFTSALYVDGNSVPITTFNTPSPLGVGSNSTALDYNIGSLSAGTHTLRIVLDSTNVITESNESDNSYTKTFTVVAPVSQPNLTPVQPSGWSAPIVVSNVTGTNTDSSPLYTTNNLYVDWAVTNNGAAATAAAFTSALYVDGNSVPITTFNTPSPLGVGSNSTALDYNIGSLSAGTHTLRIVLDSTNVITESNESDNSYTKTFTVVAPVSQPNLTPVQPSGWSAPIVVSNVTGTNTDSSPLYTTNNLYVDWAVTNNGAAATAAAFTSALYVDGNSVPITTFNTPSPLGVGSNSTALDYNIGSLSAGTHTLRIVLDSTNVITESNESDNSYTKTFTVVAPVSQPNLTPVQPSGWSAPIVVSNVTGTNTDSSPLYTTNNLYVDWAVTNNGAAATAAAFTSALYVDGNSVPITTFNTPSPLGVGSNSTALDYNIGSLSAGTHTLRIVLDSTNVITESNESDNSYTKTFTVVAPVSQPNLTPVQPSGWSAPIVVSNVTGTNTDSSPLYTTNNLYVDWAVTNNGAAATAAAFTSALYVDGNSVPITTFNTPSPLGVGSNSTALDYNIGSLSAGTHTLRIVLDSTNVITESNESDNSYTKTFTVVAPVSQPNLTPVQPSGWSAPIVVSNVTGTNTDSSPLYTTNNLYVDWAVTNNGAAATAAAFTSALYVDGNSVPITTFNTPSPLGVGSNSTALDYNIGSLSAGTHTLRIVLDSTNVITESNESDNSYTKTFTVVSAAAPVNDNFANRTPIIGTLATMTGTNVGATKEAGEPNHANNTGGKSVWWTWTAPSSAPVQIDTIGSNFDTILGVYTGSSVSSLTTIASNDDYGGSTTSMVTFNAVGGTAYQIAVDGYGGASGSITLHVTLNSVGPVNDNFANRTPIIGTLATMTGTNVGATKEAGEPNHANNTGGKSVWWTWTAPSSAPVQIDTIGSNFDTILGVYTGSSVSSLTTIASDDDYGGSTTSMVTFNAVGGTAYQIAVDGYGGASGSITLHVTLNSVGPVNDNFANRTPIIGTLATMTGTNVGATKEAGEPNHANNTGGKSVWWTWTAPSSAPVQIDTIGSNFDTILGVYTGSSVSSLTTIASNDDYGGSTTSMVTFNAVGGTAYQIAVDGYGGASGSITLHVTLNSVGPVNDNFANRTPIIGTLATMTGTNVGATKEAGEPNHANNTGGKSVWWTWTAPSSAPVQIDTIGSNFDTILGVYTGSSVSSLTTIASNDDYGGSTTSMVTFNAVGGTAYQIAVDGYGGASGSITLHVTLNSVGPVNDNFANRTPIIGTLATMTGTNVGATKEAGEPNHANNTGGKSVWWTWTAPSSAARSNRHHWQQFRHDPGGVHGQQRLVTNDHRQQRRLRREHHQHGDFQCRGRDGLPDCRGRLWRGVGQHHAAPLSGHGAMDSRQCADSEHYWK